MAKKWKIGVFGSAEGNTDKLIAKADELGEVLGNHQIIVLVGTSNGLPYRVATKASKKGTEVWEFPPFVNIKDHKLAHPDIDYNVFKKIIFVPKDYQFASDKSVSMKYRNVTTTAICDAGIIISGRWGTMNEFTNLYDMGKIIGVLTGTGGIADELQGLIQKINKPSKAKVIFDSNPNNLVKRVLEELSSISN